MRIDHARDLCNSKRALLALLKRNVSPSAALDKLHEHVVESDGSRAALDRLARELGVSRPEVLRRGMEMLARHRPPSFHDVFDALVGTFSSPSAPTDLAERHDDHAPDDLERRSSRFRRRFS
ncbi:MAG: hypothetical protein AUH78_16225 [Gemmatimonadetes bacterium 13_1_40CM_4_69_8]|nr:MAG: hypothetical protein AUH78_16225 [Gemmatimonadetes bacterium 13_1_40CM_4_69_8]